MPVVCRRASHDVRTDVAIDDPISVSANAVLLFDGLFLFRRKLNAYGDLRVLVHVDPATSVSRAAERNQGPDMAPDVVRRKYELRYEPAWLMHCDREQPDIRADLIIDNNNFESRSRSRVVGQRLDDGL